MLTSRYGFKDIDTTLVLTRCDSQNGLLAGITQGQTDRLQRVLNSSARLIFGASRTVHVTAMLRDKLHWLRIRERIVYKLCLTVHKALHQRSPTYIKELIVQASRNATTSRLRSTGEQDTPTWPRVWHKYGKGGFSYVEPTAWSRLFLVTRCEHSLSAFKTMFKTELFHQSYADNKCYRIPIIIIFVYYNSIGTLYSALEIHC